MSGSSAYTQDIANSQSVSSLDGDVNRPSLITLTVSQTRITNPTLVNVLDVFRENGLYYAEVAAYCVYKTSSRGSEHMRHDYRPLICEVKGLRQALVKSRNNVLMRQLDEKMTELRNDKEEQGWKITACIRHLTSLTNLFSECLPICGQYTNSRPTCRPQRDDKDCRDFFNNMELNGMADSRQFIAKYKGSSQTVTVMIGTNDKSDVVSIYCLYCMS